MRASETAIIFIEFQNESCRTGGKLYGLVKEEMQRQHTLPHAIHLMEVARKKGVQIIQAPYIYDAKWTDEHNVAGVVGNIKHSGAFRPGTWGAMQIEEARVKTDRGDVGLEGKRGLSAFTNTRLDKVLREKGIKHVAVCGYLTNLCVESTARSAYDRGYHVVILKDATACASQVIQEYVENQIAPAIGQAMTVAEFAAALQ